MGRCNTRAKAGRKDFKRAESAAALASILVLIVTLALALLPKTKGKSVEEIAG